MENMIKVHTVLDEFNKVGCSSITPTEFLQIRNMFDIFYIPDVSISMHY